MIYTLEAGDGGIGADLDGQDASDKLWTGGANVRFENGYFKPFDGHSAPYGAPSVVPYGIFPLRTSGSNLWAYMGLAKAYAVANDGTHTEITRASGGDYTATADTKWTGGALTGFLIFNNVNDVPQSWDGNTANDAANLANWTSTWRCAAIRPLRNYLMAVNITKTSTNYPTMVKWSHAANPGALPTSWNEADPAVDAGEQDIADANGTLVDVVGLGDQGIIYATDSYHAAQYIGGTYVWRFTRLEPTVGALSQNCAISYPGGHVVLTAGDVISHSGGPPRSIINARMRSNLFNAMDTTNFRRSFLLHNELRSEVWICIPETSQTACTKAYVWNYAQDSWGIRDLPNATAGNIGPVVKTSIVKWSEITGTWAAQTRKWGQVTLDAAKRRALITTTGTKLYLVDDGVTYDGSTPAMYVERTGLALNDSSRIKFAKSVRPEIDAPSGTVVYVRLGGAMTSDGAVTWTQQLPYTVGTSIAAYGRISGRYLAVKLESTAGAQWRCRKAHIEFEPAGKR